MTPRLFLVTDPRYTDADLLRVAGEVGEALPRGAFGVQLRDKSRQRTAVRTLAERLRVVTSACGALFVVNGDVDLAREVGADGVHLGGDAVPFAVARSAFPAGWISVAAHRDEDIARAIDAGADAALVSPIFDTPGKGPARGPSALESAKELARGRLAIYALGGVDASRAGVCRDAGADGVALVRALLDDGHPATSARAILRELETRDPPACLD